MHGLLSQMDLVKGGGRDLSEQANSRAGFVFDDEFASKQHLLIDGYFDAFGVHPKLERVELSLDRLDGLIKGDLLQIIVLPVKQSDAFVFKLKIASNSENNLNEIVVLNLSVEYNSHCVVVV